MAKKRYGLRIFFKVKGQLFEDFSNKKEATKYKSMIDDTVDMAFLEDFVTNTRDYWKPFQVQ